jgi:hypothetical protein
MVLAEPQYCSLSQVENKIVKKDGSWEWKVRNQPFFFFH